MSVETANEITVEAYGLLQGQIFGNPDFDVKAMFEKLDGQKVSGSLTTEFDSSGTSSELELDMSDNIYERSFTIKESIIGDSRAIEVFTVTTDRSSGDWMSGGVSTEDKPWVRMMPGFTDYYPLNAEIGGPEDLKNPFLTMGLGSFPDLVTDFRNTVNLLLGDGIDK